MIGCVINKLKADLNLNPEDVHLYGFSMGAHIVGFAGKEVNNPKIGAIFGLDPAGPFFRGLPDEDKLAVTDGTCVTVLHTNGYKTFPAIEGLNETYLLLNQLTFASGFGDIDALGNIDFYPNGGNISNSSRETKETKVKVI